MRPHLNIALKTAIIASKRHQRRIARLAGIEESRLSRIVSGSREPKPEEQQELARVLGVPREELFP